ncbi:1-phosphofructokinase/6-phosphofructokinase 2 [Propionicimonas paludicola]|uniref:1-phosphofructokinase/6-phosphofructokinase 2 n=1 Tax=Propionicimonas paludicola TaxID=185243 RepID=A0A2A9CTP5_9ACTN|nr:PfkB family carbohydrate kinase [Propionicimonas paludicola]PFG17804.1 1-phosphofructokinase/6-phosphofructokinase 2 [Propionicimonas paludicola]
MRAICPNPTIDRLVLLDELVPGRVDRVRQNQAHPAGKSVSAARGARANGVQADVRVLLPEQGSGWYLATAVEEGLRIGATLVPGTVRESIILLEDSGRVSVLNGTGAEVSADAWTDFLTESLTRLEPEEWVVCSGSFPPGVGLSAVTSLAARVAEVGGRLALDTGPGWLSAALAGLVKPELISPNLAEAESILSGQIAPEPTSVDADALDRAAAAADGLRALGVRWVVVTAGSAGLAWSGPDGSGTLTGLVVEVRNPIGAGDAFLGGLVARLEQGVRFAEAVGWGMATSSAAIEQFRPGAADPARVQLHHQAIETARVGA